MSRSSMKASVARSSNCFRIAWPRYELSKRATMTFDVDSRVENDPRKAEREMFAKAPYIQPGTY